MPRGLSGLHPRNLPRAVCSARFPSLLRQHWNTRRSYALKTGLAIIVRGTRPRALAHLHVAAMGKTLNVSLAGEGHCRWCGRGRGGRGSRRRGGGRRGRITRLGGGITRLARGITGLLGGITRLLWGIWLLARRWWLIRVLPRLGGGWLFLVLAASPYEAAAGHAERSSTKRKVSHV